MNILNNFLNFIQNPDNTGLLYGIAIFLIIDAFVLRVVNTRIISIKGNNMGIAVNGNVKGNITQNQASIQTPVASNNTSSLISQLANLSGIAGLIVVSATFYLTTRVSLPRERFCDIPVTKIDSPTRQPLSPQPSCVQWSRPNKGSGLAFHK